MLTETTTTEANTALRLREADSVAVVPPGESAASSMMNFIAFAVRDPTVDVAKLDALLRMQREVAADDAKAQFFRALHACQAEMPRVKKNGLIELGAGKGAIPFGKEEDLDEVTAPIRARHGFSITIDNPVRNEYGMQWVATHRHIAGHSEQNGMWLPADKGPGRNGLQEVGSTESYATRYLLRAFFKIVYEGKDDDGKRGGTRYIDDEQVAALKRGLAKHKVPETEFLRAMSVDSLTEIETKNFDEAVSTIRGYKPRPPAPTQ